MHRDGDLYSVWKFFREGAFSHWYINFESAVVRRANGSDTHDYGLDSIIAPYGSPTWKDVDELSAMVRSGRMTERQVLDVLAAAEEVAHLLEHDQRWWSGWDSWTPA